MDAWQKEIQMQSGSNHDTSVNWKVRMSDAKINPGFDVDPDEAAADAAADAEIEAGRFVSHDKVVAWLKSWGTPNELPCPEPDAH